MAHDGDARAHALEVLVAMGCVHRAGNLVEGAAVAIAPDADGDEALGRVLEWCVPRAVGGYLRVAPITLLSDEGERYRRARHDD